MKIYSYKSQVTKYDTFNGLMSALIQFVKAMLFFVLLAGVVYFFFTTLSDRIYHRCMVTATDKTLCK